MGNGRPSWYSLRTGAECDSLRVLYRDELCAQSLRGYYHHYGGQCNNILQGLNLAPSYSWAAPAALGKMSYECREMEIWPASHCHFYDKWKAPWRISGFLFTRALVMRSGFVRNTMSLIEPNCRTSFVRKQKTSEAHRPSPSLTLPDAFPWHHPQFHQSFLHALLSNLTKEAFLHALPSILPKLNCYQSLFVEVVLTQMLLYKRTLHLIDLRHLSGVRVQMNRWDWASISRPGWPQTRQSSCPSLPGRTAVVLLHALLENSVSI